MTEALYLDVELPAGGEFSQRVPQSHAAFVYPYEGGAIAIGEGDAAKTLDAGGAGILSEGDRIVVKAADKSARFLVLAGKPLKEPVVQYGPFVMNTREEIEQAIRDYQAGALTA